MKNLLQKIFSVKNSPDGLFKLVYLCGMCFRIRVKRMKLGIAYNLFDGEELLESSLKSVREAADYICVIYQTESYYGNKATVGLEDLLHGLQKKGLIDECFLYERDFSKQKNKQIFEREKRDIGLRLCKKNGMTHFLSMDVDEFYDAKQLNDIKNFIVRKNLDSTACSIYEYLKEPCCRIIDGYTFQTSGEYSSYVPFITKIRRWGKQRHAGKFFPTYVDPCRSVKCSGKFYLFPVQKVVMHHMATIRKNLDAKYANSNYQSDNSSEMSQKLEQIKKDILEWDFEKTRLDANHALFNGKVVKLVENKFDININSSM